jgi:hypothetical protein
MMLCSQDENQKTIFHPGKGNDLVIETGKDEVTYAHTVDVPTDFESYLREHDWVKQVA